jgi:hypothetical protein
LADDRDSITACPFEIMREMLDTFAESTRLIADSFEGSAVPASLSRSISSVIEANSVMFEQLAGITRRFEPGRSTTRRHQSGTFGGSRAAASAQTVVLKGPPGETVSGAFVLENQRSETVEATVLATPFVDLAGDHVDIPLTLEPSRVSLDPGQEVVVRLTTVMPAGMSLDQQLQGAIHVPGLTTSTVPVVVRPERPPQD